MYNFSINISDKNNSIAVISGINDDECQWIYDENTFYNTNINNISVEIHEHNGDIQYNYCIRDTKNLDITIIDENNNIIINRIAMNEFIDNIDDYDCIEHFTSENNNKVYYMNIDNTKISFEIIKLIGFKSSNYILKINM